MSKAPATAGMSGQQYGDWFEARVQEALEQLMAQGPFFYARLYDTKSAQGSLLPKQAADFLGTGLGTPFSLEAKASIKYESLAQPGALRALVKDHQALGAYLQGRAGGLGLIVFRSRLGPIEVWDGYEVRQIYIQPRGKLAPSDGLIANTYQVIDADVVNTLVHLLHRVLKHGKDIVRSVQ